MDQTCHTRQATLEELTDGIPTQIWEMADECTYGYANAAHAAFLGKSRAEIEHQDIHNLLPETVAELCIQNNRQAFAEKQPLVSEEWALDAAGKRTLLRISKTPRFDDAGRALSLCCTAEDITQQRMLAEQNIVRERILNAIARFSKELFSDEPNAVAQGLTTLGEAVCVDRVYYWENRFDEAAQIWLTSQKVEWCADNIEAQIENPDLQDVPLSAFSEFMNPLRERLPFLSHVKNIRSGEVRASLIAQQIQSILVLPVFVGGQFMGFVGFDSCKQEREWNEDEITLLRMFVDLLAKSIQKNMLQREVIQANENFHHFFNTIDDLLSILDLSGTILHVNERMVKKTGYAREELAGQNVLMLHPPERCDETKAVVAAMLEGKIDVCKIPLQTKDGVQFPVLTRICQGVWNGKPALFGVTQDITLLAFSAEKFSQAFENNAQLMAIVDTATLAHIEVNELFCHTLGYEKSEVIGKTPFELSLFISNDDIQFASRILSERQSLSNTETLIRARSGERLNVLVSISHVRIGALSCAIVSMLNITQRKRMEHELKQYSEHLEELVQTKVHEVADALWGTVSSLVHLAESRDCNTGGHLKRLTETCRVVASVLSFNSVYSEQLNYSFIYNLQQACLLHDIGKVGVPDSILLNPGKLTREEFEIMKQHTTIGARTLEEAYPRFQDNSILKMSIDIAFYHHERWDGKGYPKGLKGNEIPLSAQIVAICDVYDAIRSVRSYKPAYSHQESLAEIRRECGTHFNPALCDAFFNCAEEIRHIYDSYSQ
ncbi:MAG: PAS domain S-box protein [Christensenella sp.]|nr:PAS domain S-box protein [Christensenella sp.]